MAGVNVPNVTGNFNGPPPQSAQGTATRVVRVVVNEIDPNNEDLHQGVAWAAQYASEAIITETGSDAAAHDAGEAAQHAFAASYAVSRCLFAVSNDRFVYGSRGRRDQPLWGQYLRAATRAAYRILAADPSRLPMTSAEAAAVAANEAQRGGTALVLAEPIAQAAVAAARAAIAAQRSGAQRIEVTTAHTSKVSP